MSLTSPIVIISAMVIAAALVCTVTGLSLQVPPAIPPGQQLFTGPKGPTGLSGVAGLSGLGIIGPTGATGQSGTLVTKSTTGNTGFLGPTGIRGLDNITGTGPTGDKGVTGPSGTISGPVGPSGVRFAFDYNVSNTGVVALGLGGPRIDLSGGGGITTSWSSAPSFVAGFSGSHAGLWFNSTIRWVGQAAPTPSTILIYLPPFTDNPSRNLPIFPIAVEIVNRPGAAIQISWLSAVVTSNGTIEIFINNPAGGFETILSSSDLSNAGTLEENTIFINGLLPIS